MNNKEIILEFIELYKSLPSLWQIKSDRYHDREQKNHDYDIMISKLKDIGCPDLTRDAVKKKINCLRTAYRKELKKIENSRKSGAGTDDLYTPTLFYFKELDFLRDSEVPAAGCSNQKEDLVILERIADEVVTNNSADITSATVTATAVTSKQKEILPKEGGQGALPAQTPTPPGRRNKKRSAEDDFYNVLSKKLTEEEPKSLIMAKNWANQFDQLPNGQKIFAQKLINDVLYEGQLQNLNRSCRIDCIEEEIVNI